MKNEQLEIYKKFIKEKYRIDTIHARGVFDNVRMVFTNRGWIKEEEHTDLINKSKQFTYGAY